MLDAEVGGDVEAFRWSSSLCSKAPVTASHSLTVLSHDADTSCLPFGEKS